MKNMLLSIGIIFLLCIMAAVLFYYTGIHMPGRSYQGELPALTGEQKHIESRLNQHVALLAAHIGERHYEKMPALEEAAGYITSQFAALGYAPHSQYFDDNTFRNIIADAPGHEKPEQIIVVAAHYDTERGTPGADDNASGVAGLLEIARLLKGKNLKRTIRYIALVNEEMPFFGGELMGSRVSAKQSRDDEENIIGMFSLEMIGYYSQEENSQHYPKVIKGFYPSTANFIAFVGDIHSRAWIKTSIGYFREEARFPSEGLIAPQWLVPDIGRSDNSSYWHYGYPAVMVTDTANFRNPHYHRPGDRPDTLNYNNMARVVEGLARMLIGLAEQTP